MVLEKGDMWSQWGKCDLWLFTGNSYITKKKELVMGRGLALAVKKRYPDIPRLIANSIGAPRFRAGDMAGNAINVAWSIYGVSKIVYEQANGYVGVFQVKQHFRDKAQLALIGHSTLVLQEQIRQHGFERIDMNFAGIGYGGLERTHVLPIISELPDCVHVWEY